jgi:dCMP deaminase
MNKELSWDEFFIGMCLHASKKSKDKSTKLGAVIVSPDNTVLSIGFNGFPRGLDDEIKEYHLRPMKYSITEHAERNAIYNAARKGVRLEGSIMYLPFEPTPCTDCTRGVIQAGIVEVRGTDFKFTGKGKQWDDNLAIAKEMLVHAGIKRTIVPVSSEYDIRNLYKS